MNLRPGQPPLRLKNRSSLMRTLINQRYIYLMVLPGIIWFIVFCYVPMPGIMIAFQKYTVTKGIFGSPWVGLKYFTQFLTSYSFPIVLRNTLVISFLKLLFGFPAPILLALILNEVKHLAFKKTIQTISYLPNFVSWVVVLGIWYRLMSPEGGLVNTVLVSLGVLSTPLNFMNTSAYMWPVAVLTEIWKTIGWNSIIYFAALSSINPELYEAAKIDGASRLQQMRHITLPGISATISILFILAMGGILASNFDQLFILGSSPVLDVTEVIDTYIYRIGLQQLQYSLAAAAGLMRAILSLLLVYITHRVAKALGQEGLW
jgi:putative aldouronate transport system permease protein